MLLTTAGRILLAIALACFGIHYLVFAAGVISAAPGPPWYPHQDPISWTAGAFLFVAGVSLLINRLGKWSALLVGGVLIFRVTYIHFERIVANIHDPAPWTSAAEILSMAGGAFALAGSISGHTFFSAPIRRPGQVLFALPLLVFAAQHIIYARFVATLIPGWIPYQAYWPYVIAGAFIASALAILTKKLAWAASLLLGIMFLLWLAIIHVPKVIGSVHNGSEWTGLFVALAMAGSAWSVAGSLSYD